MVAEQADELVVARSKLPGGGPGRARRQRLERRHLPSPRITRRLCPTAPRLTAAEGDPARLGAHRCGANEKSSSVTFDAPVRARRGRRVVGAARRGQRERRRARGRAWRGGMEPGDCSVCCAPLMRRPAIGMLAPLAAVVAALAAVGVRHEEHLAGQERPELRGRGAVRGALRGLPHAVDVAGTEGSAVKVKTREHKDGPNFDQRKEDEEDVLYAIENGGFSSGPMPQNIVTGEDAQKIAEFIAKYSGPDAPKPSGDSARARAVLDLKAIRRDPDPVRAALARRRDGSDAAARRRAGARRAPAASCCPRSRRCARARTRPRRRSRAPRRRARTRARRSRRCRRSRGA